MCWVLKYKLVKNGRYIDLGNGNKDIFFWSVFLKLLGFVGNYGRFDFKIINNDKNCVLLKNYKWICL